ncbi:MAG: preprotein translocase subunit SecY, partial [Bacteroidota bacterium]|nr:preprotein translocase subunit SecY [Bacteroidota bacterium]
MKKFIETIKNIWKIEDLRSRIIYTLGIILIYRLGTHIVLPGIDPVIISSLANSRQGGSGILDLLNLFTGGAFARASIFGLGIMPYISASIVVQL